MDLILELHTPTKALLVPTFENQTLKPLLAYERFR